MMRTPDRSPVHCPSTPPSASSVRSAASTSSLSSRKSLRDMEASIPGSRLRARFLFGSLPFRFHSLENIDVPHIPYSTAFAREPSRRIVSVADEEGLVSFLRVSDDSYTVSPMRSIRCHRNAIFEGQWSLDDRTILTASGDHTVGRFDVETGATLSRLAFHSGTVKSVRCHPDRPDICLSASRDGSIALFDAREAGASPSVLVSLAHSPPSSVLGRRRRDEERTSVANAVAAADFISDGLFISAGSSDGFVKYWDVRKVCDGESYVGRAIAQAPGATSRPRGATSLALSTCRTRAALNTADSKLLVFETKAHEQPPLCYFGHSVNSFYVRASFSPDGAFLASGSSDYSMFIWDVARPGRHIARYGGYGGEVTDVAWDRNDFGLISTICDDSHVRLWALRELQGPHCERYFDEGMDLTCTESDSGGEWVQDSRDEMELDDVPPPAAAQSAAEETAELRKRSRTLLV